MRFQKGQSIVEFALILPLFLLLFLGIVYFASFFADYLTLSTIARNSAREAAVVSVTDESQLQEEYDKIRANYKDQSLPADMYEWDPTSTDCFSIKPDKTYENVVVEMNANLNKEGTLIGGAVDALMGDTSEKKLNLHITYTMYSEYKNNKK